MPRNMGSSSDSRRPRFGSKPGGGPGGGRGGPNRGGPHRGGKKRPFMRRKVCRFCTDQISYVDYKGSDVLRKFLTEKGKIIPRRTTGNCAKCQRKLVRAIKRARHAGLLAFQEV